MSGLLFGVAALGMPGIFAVRSRPSNIMVHTGPVGLRHIEERNAFRAIAHRVTGDADWISHLIGSSVPALAGHNVHCAAFDVPGANSCRIDVWSRYDLHDDMRMRVFPVVLHYGTHVGDILVHLKHRKRMVCE